jgi:hypothetical protein
MTPGPLLGRMVHRRISRDLAALKRKLEVG